MTPQRMSSTQAFFLLFILAAGLAVDIWLLWRNWSPDQLRLWATIVWILMAVLLLIPPFLPASIRWNDTMSVIQGLVGLTIGVLSIKCLILLLRHGSALTASQRTAAWFGIVPLLMGLGLVLVFFGFVGLFSSRK